MIDTSEDARRTLPKLVKKLTVQEMGRDMLVGADAVASVRESAPQGTPLKFPHTIDEIDEPKLEHTADGPEFNTANATPVTEMTLIAVEACSDPTVNDIVILTLNAPALTDES